MIADIVNSAIHQLPLVLPVVMRLLATFLDCRFHGCVHSAIHFAAHHLPHGIAKYLHGKVASEVILVTAMAVFGVLLDLGLEHLRPEGEPRETAGHAE